MDDVGNRIPFTTKLADLLLIYIQCQRNLVIALARLSVHGWDIQPTARSCVQNTHQRPLRIAIAKLKSLHVKWPPNSDCRFEISD